MYKADYIVVGLGAAGAAVLYELAKKHKVIGVEAGEDLSCTVPIKNSSYANLLHESFDPFYFYQQEAVHNGMLTGVNEENKSSKESSYSYDKISKESNYNYNKSSKESKYSYSSDKSSKENKEEKKEDSKTLKIRCAKIMNPKTEEEEHEIPHSHYTTGRLLGGGSSINGEQCVFGSFNYWKQWEKYGWSANKVYRTYHRLVKEGLIKIREAPAVLNEMDIKLGQALSSVTTKTDDYNSKENPLGYFNRWQLFQFKDGTRASSNKTFLKKANCKNYKLLLKTTVLRVIFENCKGESKAKAIGVEALQNGKCIKIYANKEVILSCGIYSAQLLQLSGVGPCKLLKCLDVPLVYDNKHVGRSYKNHPLVNVVLSTNPDDTKAIEENALYTDGAFFPPLLEQDNKSLRGYQFIGIPADNSLVFTLIYLQPHSEGRVQIQSSDPLTVSLADNDTLGNELDVKAFVLGIQQYVIPIINKLNEIDSKYALITPSMEVLTDEEKLTEYIMSTVDITHHWTGSNRIGRVVGSEGSVKGVKNLRVIDDSIAPFIPDGNTCAPAYVIASIIGRKIRKSC